MPFICSGNQFPFLLAYAKRCLMMSTVEVVETSVRKVLRGVLGFGDSDIERALHGRIEIDGKRMARLSDRIFVGRGTDVLALGTRIVVLPVHLEHLKRLNDEVD